jgi:hypothetical protein
VNDDVVVALADLAGRSGARDLNIGWDCPHVPAADDGHSCGQVTWWASVSYQGARLMVDQHHAPSVAALALAERILDGASCRCGQRVTLTDDRPGCRWRLAGPRWEPSCDVPSLPVPGRRGDVAAMQAALAKRRNGRSRGKRGRR